MPELSAQAPVQDGLRAIVFDLDGTLYLQGPLRRAMLGKLVLGHLLHPLQALRTMRALGAYRKAQEALRGAPRSDDLAALQLTRAAEKSGLPPREVSALVERWMDEAPLPILGRYLRPGARELLTWCKQRGLRLGLLSDYPAEKKLEALGLDGLFEVVLCAQDARVGVFKPDPRGLLAVLEALSVAPAQALYVGDRVEVDAQAARAGGLACAIFSRAPAPAGASFRTAADCAALRAIVESTTDKLSSSDRHGTMTP